MPQKKLGMFFFFICTERPEILPFLFPTEVKEGQPLQVGCTILTGDEPISIQWYKDGHPLVSSPKFMINKVTPRMTLLVLQDASSEHTGTYMCKAFNPVGQAEFSATLEVMGNRVMCVCGMTEVYFCFFILLYA